MTSQFKTIYDVETHKYAFSGSGELGTKGLSPCVAIIIVFSNRSVMIEHRADSELHDDEGEFDAKDLFEDIIDNIQAIEKQHLEISYVFIIGGCDSIRRQGFQKSLLLARSKFLNEREHEPNLLNHLLSQFYRAMKVLNVTWSIRDRDEYSFNEPFIDVLIAKDEGGGFNFYICQFVHLVDNITKKKTAVCCARLRYKLFDVSDANGHNDLSLTHAEYYVQNEIAEEHRKEQKDYLILHDSIVKFRENVQSLGAAPVNMDVIDFITSIDKIFNRMCKSPQQDVLIKDFESFY